MIFLSVHIKASKDPKNYREDYTQEEVSNLSKEVLEFLPQGKIGEFTVESSLFLVKPVRPLSHISVDFNSLADAINERIEVGVSEMPLDEFLQVVRDTST